MSSSSPQNQQQNPRSLHPCGGGGNGGRKRPHGGPEKPTSASAATSDSSQPLHRKNIPISLGKPSLRLRLETYYSLISPDVLTDDTEWRRKFDLIYQKYGGTVKGERALATKLAKKYGDTVRLKLANDEDTDNPSGDTADQWKRTLNQWEERKIYPEEHYHLTTTQRNSGVLDFASPDFDPNAALSVPTETILEANPFVVQAPLLDYLDKFRTVLPRCDPLRLVPPPAKKKKKSASSATGAGPGMEEAPETKRKKLPPLAALAEKFQHAGPFSLLHSIYTNRQRVRILIRYVDCIRGTLTGYLLAFDKHYNMILRDVDECYTGRKFGKYDEESGRCDDGLSKAERETDRRALALGSGGGGEGRGWTEEGSGGGQQVRQRWMKQLLVRGDNVVMVWRANDERSAWPRTGKSPVGSMYRKAGTKTSDSSSKVEDTESGEVVRVGTPGSLIYALQRSQRGGVGGRREGESMGYRRGR